MVLWTQSHLAAARAIYQAEGYRKVSSEKHFSFGKRLVAEVWELQALTARPRRHYTKVSAARRPVIRLEYCPA